MAERFFGVSLGYFEVVGSVISWGGFGVPQGGWGG